MSDARKNFAYSTVATAPSPASSGTSLVVATGEGTRFPSVPFSATVWPAGALPLPSNAEIVRVTNISSDTLTITRTQESTSARTIIVGDQIAETVTVAFWDQILKAGSSGQVWTSNGTGSDASFQAVDISSVANGPIVTIQARNFLK